MMKAERVCCYGGRGLRSNESKWSITELEALAIVEGVRVYHTYLAGGPFEIVTDHVSHVLAEDEIGGKQ